MSSKKKKMAGMQKKTKNRIFIKKTALPAKPNRDADLNLGTIYSSQGNYEGAAACFQRVLSVDPEDSIAHYNLGYVFQAQGKLVESITCFKRALSIKPNYLEAHYNLSVVYLRQDKYEEAAACLKRVLSLRPEDINAQLNLSVVYMKQGKYEEAAAYLQRILSIKPDHRQACLNLGVVRTNLYMYEEAAVYLEKALSINPGSVDAHFNLGVIRKSQGRFEDAVDCCKKVLSIKPDHAESHFLLASLQKYSGNEDQLFEMEQLFSQQVVSDEKKMYLAFGLGKAYEDSGFYEKAFYFLKRGNKLKRATYEYSEEETEAEFKQIKRTFTKSFIQNNSKFANPDNSPIFILGMPRSGTSLVEQILASHPDVEGAGELSYLGEIISRLSKADSVSQACEHISEASEEIITCLGPEYIQKIRKFSAEKKFITDKMPRNFLWIGAIILALPNAKIISCVRDPMDNCFSIYKNHFKDGHKYAFDLHELGRYHLHYQDLILYWHEVFPGKIYTLSYEKLVNDQEAETRKLLKYCGLSWDDACLSFHKTSRAVETASAAQVRKPIYKDSLQLWKRYEKELQPLSEILLGRER
jgi:tetratricopeptide (TPR) repeat protein